MPPKKKKMAKKSKTFANFSCYSTRYSGSRSQTPDLQNSGESSTQSSQQKIHFRREFYFSPGIHYLKLEGEAKCQINVGQYF